MLCVMNNEIMILWTQNLSFPEMSSSSLEHEERRAPLGAKLGQEREGNTKKYLLRGRFKTEDAAPC